MLQNNFADTLSNFFHGGCEGDVFTDEMFSHDILSHEDYDNQVAEEFIEQTGIGMTAFSENPTLLELSTANTILKMKLKIEQIMSGRADPTEMIHDAFDLMDKSTIVQTSLFFPFF